MLEKHLGLYTWNRVFTVGTWIFVAILIGIPAAALVFFANTSDSDNYWDEYYKKYGATEIGVSKYRRDHAIHDDILYPYFQSLWIPLPRIEDHLNFVQYNSRPDCNPESPSILLGLKGQKEEVFIKEGTKVYFDCKNQDEISFSTEETPFWIETKLKSGDRLGVTLLAKYLDVEGQDIFESVSKFTISDKRQKTLTEINDTSLKEIAEFFAQAKCFAPDQLFNIYGGREYQGCQKRYRIVLSETNGPHQLFVSENDLIVFDNGEWKVSTEDTCGKPLAQVKSLQRDQCEMILWEKEGIHSVRVALPVEKDATFEVSISDLFSKLFKRTENSVMCNLAGKSLILRKGDWLLKRDNGWKNLRNIKEVKSFLGYALKGELFIFDGIETRDKTCFFTGHYFNVERTQVVKVDLKISEKKQRESSPINLKKPNPRLTPKKVEGKA